MARTWEREWDMHNLGKDDGKGIWENGFTDGMAFARDTRLISISLLLHYFLSSDGRLYLGFYL